MIKKEKNGNVNHDIGMLITFTFLYCRDAMIHAGNTIV